MMTTTATIDAMPLADIVSEMHVLHDTATLAHAAANRYAKRCRRCATRHDARDYLAGIDDQCRTLRTVERAVESLRLAMQYRPHAETAYYDATTTTERSARSAAYGQYQHAAELAWRVLAVCHRVYALRCTAEATLITRWPWREVQ
ncbi:MAG: hypothetical protein KGS47_16190 [Chloroflexi bacterium]|nr:hypothetical protein [Chloroflexota bacterium]